MNFGDLLGAVLQSEMSPSSTSRLRTSLGGGGNDALESLGGMLGDRSGGGGLGDALANSLGGGGGLGGMLGDVLGAAGRSVGGNQNLALGGLGALAGALLGGGRRSAAGGLGGGVMALLGAMAFKALQGGSRQAPAVPLGLREPQTLAEQNALEKNAELVLRAMINAAKADGRIDEAEIRRIVGKLEEMGADRDAQAFVMTQMQAPPETESLTMAAKGQPELAAQMFAASLMAIEVDTPAEKRYLDQLAAGLGLDSRIARNIETMVGL